MGQFYPVAGSRQDNYFYGSAATDSRRLSRLVPDYAAVADSLCELRGEPLPPVADVANELRGDADPPGKGCLLLPLASGVEEGYDLGFGKSFRFHA